MSGIDLDLSEAVIEKAIAGYFEYDHGTPWDSSRWDVTEGHARAMEAAVVAVAPLIAAQAVQCTAREIEAEAESRRRDINETAVAQGGAVDVHANDVRFGVEVALLIARRLASEAARWSPR